MKDITMAGQWRTIKFFLSEEGVFEVEGDLNNHRALRCSCPRFLSSRRCNHTKHVRKEISDNNNSLNIRIPEKVTDDEILASVDDKDLFREIILKHSPIEVID